MESLDTNGVLRHRQPQRKLVLYFDARNTIFVADSITNVTPEQALNAYLTGVLWGRQLPQGAWSWESTEPSLRSPRPGSGSVTTYYKYLEAEIVTKPADRETLRLAVGDFTQTLIGKPFEQYHTRHLELLRWRHPAAAHDKLTLEGEGGARYHYILPALYKMMEKLSAEGRQYSVVVRTYGLDCGNVLESIQYALAGGHPDFPRLPAMNVRRTPGTIGRGPGGIELRVLDKKGRVRRKVEGDRALYAHFCRSAGVTGYVDDFDAWQSDGYSHRSAKPLWLDPDDCKHHHIFFDDNYRPGMQDSIVDVRLLNGDEATSLSVAEAAAYADVSAVQVDLLACIRDESYFYDRIVECERNLKSSI